MYYLVYSSKPTPLIYQRSLEQILETSRNNNTRADITGLLLYNNSKFIQVLEGEEEQVKKVYNTIIKDNRHAHILKIIEGYTEERQFPDWSMAYREIDDAECASVEGEIKLVKAKIIEHGTSYLLPPLAVLLKSFLPRG